MDRFDAMAVLVTAVDAGSLSAGGRRLGMPLATVSRKISELEARLGTRLLTRTSRKLALTDAGQAYLAACRRILEEVSEAERAAAGEYSLPRGELAITAPIVFGRLHVLPVIAEFLAAYPDIDVRLALTDRSVNLLEDPLDLAVRIGALPDSSLVATRVGTVRRVTCGSPDYFARRGRPVAPADLAGHDCISFEGLAAAHAWTYATSKMELSVPVRSRLVLNAADAAVAAALAGVGIARLLSYQVAQHTRSGALALILEAFEPPAWPVHLVYTGQGRVPLKLRAFLDFAAPRLKARATLAAPA
jgi:DNA-binding transcriptional LysR family regulator